jgi:hypothetical protein
MQRTHTAPIAGSFARAALSAWSLVRGRPARHTRATVGEVPPSTAEIDALWAATRSGFTAAQTRDGAYIHWRYARDQREHYRFVSVRDAKASTLLALVVLRLPSEAGDPRLRGVKVATIADLLYDSTRPELGFAALAAAERSARKHDADALLSSTPSDAFQPLLARRAYVRLPGNVHFFTKDTGATCAFPKELDAWWLTRGDGESDGAF